MLHLIYFLKSNTFFLHYNLVITKRKTT